MKGLKLYISQDVLRMHRYSRRTRQPQTRQYSNVQYITESPAHTVYAQRPQSAAAAKQSPKNKEKGVLGGTETADCSSSKANKEQAKP